MYPADNENIVTEPEYFLEKCEGNFFLVRYSHCMTHFNSFTINLIGSQEIIFSPEHNHKF